MKKKFLVLGSNSFSGSSFISFLLKKNYKVLGTSRSKEYNKAYLPYKNSKNIKNFKFLQIDINKDIKKLVKVVKKIRPDYIVNYMAQGMVGESWITPEDWYKTNVVSQVILYKELSKLKFIKKFIHVTTPEVYGNTDQAIKENFDFNPSTPYAISRAATDQHLKKHFDNFKLPVIFTRTANVYGPHQQLYRIVPKALLFSKLQKKIQLHGGGLSKRSFIFIDDASEATYLICLKGAKGETYHISTNKIVSIKEIVKKISIVNNVKFSKLVSISKERIGKDNYYKLNSSKIRKLLNWKPKVNLDLGIKKTSNWIDNNLSFLKKQKTNYLHKR